MDFSKGLSSNEYFRFGTLLMDMIEKFVTKISLSKLLR